jgi:hypothetical protein
MSDETPVTIGFTKEEAAVILEALHQYGNILDAQYEKINMLPDVIRIAARNAGNREVASARDLARKCGLFVYDQTAIEQPRNSGTMTTD